MSQGMMAGGGNMGGNMGGSMGGEMMQNGEQSGGNFMGQSEEGKNNIFNFIYLFVPSFFRFSNKQGDFLI